MDTINQPKHQRTMIPVFEQFLYPFLKVLEDGKIRTKREMDDLLADYLNLSKEDKTERTRSGTHPKLYDRVQWAGTYTRMAGLTISPDRGQYQITEEGKKLLQSNIKHLSRKFLIENYPSFKEFATKSNTTDKSPNNVEFEQMSASSPTDNLENAYEEIQESVIEELLAVVKKQSSQFFEQLVVDLLVKMGYGGSFEESGYVTQYAKDGGIDGIIKEDKLGLDKVYIQAKQWNKEPDAKNKVSRPEIDKFVGAIVNQGGSKGIFVTTCEFTKEATKSRSGSVKLILIDGVQLCKYMIQYNLGITTQKTYEIKKIDSDYFEI